MVFILMNFYLLTLKCLAPANNPEQYSDDGNDKKHVDHATGIEAQVADGPEYG